jgi:uncharacterized protein YdeI (YjbR/CyaY-like superfamily)
MANKSEQKSMTVSEMNPKVDAFLGKAKKWQAELEKLRRIVLDCRLKEELKWYQPCYTFENNNVLIISGFKDYCALNFFKGTLLSDPSGLLVKPGKNTQAGSQIRFTGVSEIADLEPILKSYITEAIGIEKAGLKVNYKKTEEFVVPGEFQSRLDEFPELKTAFETLTPGRQRAYLLHFAAPKQSVTRSSRVEKCMAQILGGKGLND